MRQQRLTLVRWLLCRGRCREAREEIRQTDRCPLAYRVLAALPGAVVGGLLRARQLVRTPLLGAVGVLQFDVLQYRLQTEYGAPSRVESAPWSVARWVRAKGSESFVTSKPPQMKIPTGGTLVRDPHGAWVVLLPNAWSARYFQDNNPDLEVAATPPMLDALAIS